MAITFLEQRKKQRYLFLVLAAMALATLFILWLGFFRKERPSLQIVVEKPAKIEINWEVLGNKKLGELEPFGEISPFDGQPGRENPFIPY